MERKGLSQILYLIIAASVLMMIAMVVTFTATDIVGGLGGQATNSQCQDAITGKCASVQAQSNPQTKIPSTCVDSETNSFLTSKQVYNAQDNDGSLSDAINAPEQGTPPYYVECN